MENMFRSDATNWKLDKKYLRICSVYKFLKENKISKRKGIKLLRQKMDQYTSEKMIEIWFSGPFKNR